MLATKFESVLGLHTGTSHRLKFWSLWFYLLSFMFVFGLFFFLFWGEEEGGGGGGGGALPFCFSLDEYAQPFALTTAGCPTRL